MMMMMIIIIIIIDIFWAAPSNFPMCIVSHSLCISAIGKRPRAYTRGSMAWALFNVTAQK